MHGAPEPHAPTADEAGAAAADMLTDAASTDEAEIASRAWSTDSTFTANEENELATIRVRTMYG